MNNRIPPPLTIMDANVARAWLKVACPGAKLPRLGRVLLVVLPAPYSDIFEIQRIDNGRDPKGARYSAKRYEGEPRA